MYHNQGGFIPGMQNRLNKWKIINRLQFINRMEGEIHVINSVDGKKAFAKMQYSSAIETLNKLGKEENFLNLVVIRATTKTHS